MSERTDEIMEQLATLEEERDAGSWLATWEELRDFLLPHRAFFISRGAKPNKGDREGKTIFDNTATIALERMSDWMHSGLTNPAQPWMRLQFADEDLNDYAPGKEYLRDCEKVMYRGFRKSNFYKASHSAYLDMGGFGQAVVFEEEDWQQWLWFRNEALGCYVMAEGREGRVDTLMRRFFLRARQCVLRFKTVSERIRRIYDKTPQEFIELVHVVRPRQDWDDRRLSNLKQPYESIYLDHDGDNDILEEGGFKSFPYFCPRWATSGADTFGRSPGWMALPTIKTLQNTSASALKAIHRTVEPPLSVPERLKGFLDLRPNGLNFVAPNETVGPLMQINPNFQVLEAKIIGLQERLKQCFFNDVFLTAVSRTGMTATEVIERNQEKLLQLGPVIERIIDEFLGPCVRRTWGLLADAGHLPDPPPDLAGSELTVEFISPLAQAQKQSGSQSLTQFVGFVGQVAQGWPEVMDRFDPDKAATEMAEILGVPPGVIRSDDEVAQIRQLKAQREQAMMQAQQQMAGAAQAKNLAGAASQLGQVQGPGGQNMLQQILQQMGGAA